MSIYDFLKGEWNILWPGRVARHDLVYHAPPEDPMQGIPLGNGDVGVLCWCSESSLILAVNKCDLWDDLGTGEVRNWQTEENDDTLRHACRIIINFQVPVFDLFYRKSFNGRLSLADACMSLCVSSLFGDLEIKLFVNHDDGAIYGDIVSSMQETTPISITVERFGSRTFAHWYSQIKNDPSIGGSGTNAFASGNTAFITHRLAGGTFAAGISARTENRNISGSKLHSRMAELIIDGGSECRVNFVAGVTSPMSQEPEQVLMQNLDMAEKRAASAWESHQDKWKKFWLRSLMESGDDYLDNLWHLTMYYANASQRGRYPGRFINGLWGWNRDYQPWNLYFHWNQQQIYWPLNAAGHHDLLTSYLNYRFDSLPKACASATEIFGSQGAFVSDVSDRRGNNSVCENRNHTPVAQIAMDFWRQYKYTGDREFLKKQVYPYIVEAARFFMTRFEFRNGQYHALKGTGYEGWIELNDCISEIACGKILFQAALEAANEVGEMPEEAETWRDILHRMVDLPKVDAEIFLDSKQRFSVGCFKGEEALDAEVFSAGFGVEEQRWLTSIVPAAPQKNKFDKINDVIRWMETVTSDDCEQRETSCYHGIFPNVEYSTVFPSGLIGLGQYGKKEYNIAVNTAKAFSPDIMGWDPLPIVLARLGLSDELWKIITSWPDHWQYYCNGFGHYGPHNTMRRDAAARFRTMKVRDFEEKQEQPNMYIPAWPFRHMGMESMSILAAAMNEAMLQSYDGVIRIAPAADREKNARFTLHAQGGFVVSAEIAEDMVQWVCIEAERGGVCKLFNPWEEAFVYKENRLIQACSKTIIELNVDMKERLLFFSKEKKTLSGKIETINYQANSAPKTAHEGLAVLGIR
ncbi:MAG: hypothetical protein JXR78_03405 [Victivallales bacterium]|nr:hypothetical protein [Victivallales bacterium]